MDYGKIMLPAVALSCIGLSACGGGSSDSSSAATTAAASGQAAAAAPAGPLSTGGNAQIMVDASNKLAPIGAHQIGVNMAIWYDVTSAGLLQEVQQLSPNIIRWPGGSTSDQYHWQQQTECSIDSNGSYTVNGPAYNPASTFDTFMKDIVIPGGYDAALTVPYGTNAACNGGGDPAEAAAWVAYAKQQGYNQHIHYWTVGNEVFGGWEADMHSTPHDPATYAAAMAGSNGYYAQMKAADPDAQVGAFTVAATGGAYNYNDWDKTVLSKAQYDFVEFHWYPQQPGQENDTTLLTQLPQNLTATVNSLRQELQDAGKPATTPIMLGEVNSVTTAPGKQSMSIVNALFTGMVAGEALNDNLTIATWWFGAGGSQGCTNNNSSSLYGWQNWGGYDLVAANSTYSWNDCGNGTVVPEGTVFPSGNAFAMAQQFAQPGNTMLGVTVDSSLSNVRAYAATQGDGYALMLFNLDQSNPAQVSVGVKNAATSSFSASTVTYGKKQYDDSQNNVWTGPVSATLGNISGTASVNLPPWSMTVLKLQ